MKIFKFNKQGFSLMEILIAMSIIAVALLLSIRVYPYIFTLNRQIEDVNVAKNLTEQLFQTLRAEINTGVLQYDSSGNSLGDLVYYGKTTLKSHNLVNSRKCFWQLVTLTEIYGPPPGLDTYLFSDQAAASTQFDNINPSRFEPASGSDWVATKQFWKDWRNNVEKQLPPYNQASDERASAIVTARYVTFDGDNNLIIAENGNYAKLADNVNYMSTGQPNLNSKDYMIELTVALYWRPRKFEGPFARNVNRPNYMLSTLLTAPPEAILKDPTPTPNP